MLGISFFELLIVAILTIIIIGPKELPSLTRNVIKLILKAKGFIQKTGKELGLEEIKMEIEKDIIEEVAKLEKETTSIIDIYGNEHQVYDIDQLREDKNKEELEAEIIKYNTINSSNVGNSSS